jgi:starch synthase
MRLLLASSEVFPYSKTGGLADMVSGLAKALAHAGHDVTLVTPLYQGAEERFQNVPRGRTPVQIPLGTKVITGELLEVTTSPSLRTLFVAQEDFFMRPSLYQAGGVDYPDNFERFLFFSKVIAQLALQPNSRPDLVMLNDWQTGLAALYLEHHAIVMGRRNTPASCMTIHNLAYQGNFPREKYELTNLPWKYFSAEGVEFYGRGSCLKAGLVYATKLTTVSPTYAREIQTAEFGCGFDGLLRARADSLTGILNGVDYEEWDAGKDANLRFKFTAEDLAGKTQNKLSLQEEFGLPQRADVPLFGHIGRLVEHKGVDILLGALEETLRGDIQFVQIGNGTPFFEDAYRKLAQRFPGKAAVRIGFDESVSHRIEAGSDFFLMPSRFEPCGLNQMYSLHYGTVPLVRATGGLCDSVVDIREDQNRANGIKFDEYSVGAVVKAMRKALALYQETPLLVHFRKNGMRADFSWARAAAAYVEVFERATGR